MVNIAPIPSVGSQHTGLQVQTITGVYRLLEDLVILSRLSWKYYEQEGVALVLFGGVRQPRYRPRLPNRLCWRKGV